jgi:hypothetical protein
MFEVNTEDIPKQCFDSAVKYMLKPAYYDEQGNLVPATYLDIKFSEYDPRLKDGKTPGGVRAGKSHFSVANDIHFRSGTGPDVSSRVNGDLNPENIDAAKKYDGRKETITVKYETELSHTSSLNGKFEGMKVSSVPPGSNLGWNRNVLVSLIPSQESSEAFLKILREVSGIPDLIGLTNQVNVFVPFHCAILQANI